MPELRTPRQTWILEGLRALGVGGPDAVRIEKLARALGVTKGGFYGYFADRSALLDEMLDTWEHVVVDQAMELIEGGGGDARAKLRRLFEVAMSVPDMRSVELAIREWARRDGAVAERLVRVDDRRLAYLRSLFDSFCRDEDEVEARSLLAAALFVADPLIVASHAGRSRRKVLELALDHLLA